MAGMDVVAALVTVAMTHVAAEKAEEIGGIMQTNPALFVRLVNTRPPERGGLKEAAANRNNYL